MFWLAIFIIAVLDYLRFKLKYKTPKGPPVWCGLPVVGMLPVVILPKFIFVPLYDWYLKNAPDVLIIRLLRPTLILKGNAIKKMQQNRSCFNRAVFSTTNFLGWITTGSFDWVFFEGSKSSMDFESHRRLTTAAFHVLSKRQIFQRVTESVNEFLYKIDDHHGQVWDPTDELFVAKYHESANINLGETIEDSHVRTVSKYAKKLIASSNLLIVLTGLLPLNIILRLEPLLPHVLRPRAVGRVYKELLLRLQLQRAENYDHIEEPRDFIAAVLRVKSDPGEAHHFLREASMVAMLVTTHSTHHLIMTMLSYLAAFPRCQQKTFEEIERIVGKHEFSVDHLEEMHYLKAVIAESNRMSTPVPFITRETNAPTTLEGYEIPAQMNIVAVVHSENFDEKAFPEPQTFMPERFIDSEGHFVNDPNLGSFSRGKRGCPGKMITFVSSSVFLTKILQLFEIVPAKAGSMPLDFGGEPFPPPRSLELKFVRREGIEIVRSAQPTRTLTKLLNEILQAEKDGKLPPHY